MRVDEGWIPSDGSTVEDLIESYINFSEGRGTEEATIDRYRAMLVHNISPHIGRIDASDLQENQLDRLYALLLTQPGPRGRPLSPTTVRHVHNLINASYRWAVRKRRLQSNPASFADPPVRSKVRGRAAQLGEAHKIIEACGDHRMGAPILFALSTGMRRGEIVALREEHIDLEAGIVRVCESIGKGTKSGLYRKKTKTDEPREIPLSDLALGALKLARLRRATWKLKAGQFWQDTGCVFSDELGRRIVPNVLTDAFRRLLKPLGIRYRLHDLRHTAATFMLHSGVDLVTVQQILGHAAASTTLGVYGHAMTGAKAKGMDALDAMLRRAADET